MESPVAVVRRPGVLPMALALVVAAAVLSPVLGAGFFGDDLDLWHVGRELLVDPGIALVGPSNFYRPANAWLFAAHHVVLGTWTAGYHATTLLMHLGCGLLLGLLLRRLGIGSWGAAAGATFWMLSPFAFEPVMFVNVSYNDLTVLLVWLGLACLWPGLKQRWGRGRLLAAVTLVGFSVFCKESWVVVAPLAAVFELTIGGRGLRRAVQVGAVLAVPVTVYVAAYTVAFGGRGDYYDIGQHMVTKVPHLWACFSLVTRLQPFRPGFGPAEGVGLGLLLVLVLVSWRRRDPMIWLGLSWFGLTLLPVLPVSFIPTRYTTVPLVGFVLAMAGAARVLAETSAAGRRRAVRVATGALLACLIVVEAVQLQGEVTDMRRLSGCYDELLAEADRIAPELPPGLPLVCVRLEAREPLRRLQTEGYAGLDKIQFVRGDAPYGLAAWPALLTFIRNGRGDELYLDAGPLDLSSTRFAVLAHRDGGFELLEPATPSVGAELEHWRRAGLAARAVVPRVDR